MASDIEVVLFYTFFILFVIYVSGLAGYNILINAEAIGTYELTEYSLDPFQAFGNFFTLFFIDTGYTVLGLILFAPYSIILIFVALRWLRGQG